MGLDKVITGLGRVLTPIDGVLVRRGKGTGRRPGSDRGRHQSGAAASQRVPRVARGPGSSERARKGSPYSLQEARLCPHLTWGFQPPEPVREDVSVL